jgi:hypothetical protein
LYICTRCESPDVDEVAEKNRVDMRTLDRALWQFSKENQNQKAEEMGDPMSPKLSPPKGFVDNFF